MSYKFEGTIGSPKKNNGMSGCVILGRSGERNIEIGPNGEYKLNLENYLIVPIETPIEKIKELIESYKIKKFLNR